MSFFFIRIRFSNLQFLTINVFKNLLNWFMYVNVSVTIYIEWNIFFVIISIEIYEFGFCLI